MPHVDEGQLHALLDGALPDDTAQHIRDHIAECAECRTRLHDEETVRTRAAQLLGIATPHAHVPPFETVLQRAPEAIREGSRFRIPGPARLAWAASIILALGIGWFGRDLGPFGAVPAREEAASSSAPAEGRDARVAEPQAAPPPAAPQPEAARANAPTAPKALVGTGGELSTAGRVEQNRVRAEADQAKPPTEQRAAQRFAVEQSERMRDTAAQRAGEAAGAKAVAVTPPVVAQAQKTLADETQPAISWEFVTEQEAERRAGRPVMTIPGLEVVNVGVAVSGSGFLVRTTQRLADQNLIELLQEAVTVVDPTAEMRREAVAAAAAPAPAQPTFRTDATGAVILKIKRGNLMLTGRAALPVDSLRALMQRATN